MDTSTIRLIYLFNRYYEKTATKQEIDEFYELVHASDNDEQLLILLQQLWEKGDVQPPVFSQAKSEEILDRILRNKDKQIIDPRIPVIRKRPFLFWTKVAATVLIFFAVSVFFYHWSQSNSNLITKRTEAKVHHDVLPGGNRAILTLSNGTTIKLDNQPNGMLAHEGTSKISKTAGGKLIYNSIRFPHPAEGEKENMISTPRGGQYQITLSDGSKVWLNAASSLRFPATFTGKIRQVEITGEAYFEVAKNAAIPFIVKTRNAEVQVLGTHFNVMAYDDEAVSKTTLLEGAVKIKSTTDVNVLKPGEQALLNTHGRIDVSDHVDVEAETAWKNGTFSFKEASIEDVMRQIARWYDVTISYESRTLPVKQLTGSISRSVKASELLSMLSYTGINFQIEGKKIIVTN